MSNSSPNRETDVIRAWLKQDSNCWIAIAAGFLRMNEREIAVERLTNALKYLLRDGPPSMDTLGGRLYRTGVSQFDYRAMAIEIIGAAEAADSSLGTAYTGQKPDDESPAAVEE